MTFLNRRLLSYAAIVFASTLLMYLLFWKPDANTAAIIVSTICYVLILVLGCIFINRNDPYQYFGFNYHFVTYVICIGIPLWLRAVGRLPEPFDIGSMALNWGIGIFVHFIVFLILARKRRLKGYDKAEIFQ